MSYRFYSFRIYPTHQQEKTFEETLETCRRLYNSMLSDRLENRTSVYGQKKRLVELKRDSKYLRVVHSQVLQDVVLRLNRAFQAFFAGRSKHPKFKRKDRYKSFTYPQSAPRGGFKLLDGRLGLSGIGRIRIILHRTIHGRVKTCTIIKDIDQWYACFAVESDESLPRTCSRPPVGVDVGISPIVALSDGTTISSPRFLKRSEVDIKGLQKSLSRKREGSSNWQKTKLLLAKASRRVRNRRNDFAHKTSKSLADSYGLIVFEDLAITNMVKNHSLASAILDACWGKLRRLTAYKAEGRGGRAILVEPRGSSQECSGCRKNIPKDLSERVHRCPYCGLVLERNVNAARVILARGLEQAHAEAEPLPVMRIGMFGRGSKKPTSHRE